MARTDGIQRYNLTIKGREAAIVDVCATDANISRTQVVREAIMYYAQHKLAQLDNPFPSMEPPGKQDVHV